MRKFFQNLSSNSIHSLVFCLIWMGMYWLCGNVLASLLLAAATALLLVLTAPLWMVPLAVIYAARNLHKNK